MKALCSQGEQPRERVWSRGGDGAGQGKGGRPRARGVGESEGWGGDGRKWGWRGGGGGARIYFRSSQSPSPVTSQGLSSLMKSIVSPNVSQQLSKVQRKAARDGQEREEIIF